MLTETAATNGSVLAGAGFTIRRRVQVQDPMHQASHLFVKATVPAS